MKQFVITIAALATLTCCTTLKQLASSLPSTLSCNPTFMQLWNDFTALKGSSLSQDFIQKYLPEQDEESYIIAGYITTNESFSKDSFEALGGTLVDYNNGLYSFRMPIKNLTQMVQLQGITRIELAPKAELK